VRHEELKFVPSRELGDGNRWKLRSATGETLAASGARQPNKSACEADLRSFMADHHHDVEVLDATAPWASGLSAFLLSYSPKRIEEEELSRVRPQT
jgi:hypothetical protein